METDSIPAILQRLGRNKETGTLHLVCEAEELDLAFHRGTIVGASEPHVDSAEKIAEMLVDAGVVVDKILDLVRQAKIGVEQLQQVLVSKNYIGEAEFQQARRAYELNLLYRLREHQQVQFEFEPQAAVNAGALQLAPAQLLLDMVELEADEQRFLDIFGDASSEDCLVYRNAADESGLTEQELSLWNVIAEEGSLAADVMEMSLQNRYVVIEGLLGLYESGAIRVENLSGEAQGGADFFDGQPAESGQDFADFEDGARSGETADPDQSAAGQQEAEGEFPSEFEPESHKWAKREQSSAHHQAISFRTINFRLLEPRRLRQMTFGVMLLFLIGIAILVPGGLEQWFRALSEFTSKP